MAPETASNPPVNLRSRYLTFGGIALVILLIIAYSWYKNRLDSETIADLQSKDKAVHVAAVKGLIDKDRFVDLILAQTPDVRDASIVASEDLAAQGPDAAKKAVQALLGICKGVDREINDPDKAIRDREGAVRGNAWKAIGRTAAHYDAVPGKALVITPILFDALKDPSGNVRGAAVESLGYVGAPAVPGLMKMIVERDTRDPAGDALAKIGQPSLEPLRPLIDTPGDKLQNRSMRLKMAGMLPAFDNQVVVPDLLRHIDDVDPGMRRQVIRSLAGLQDQRATPKVIEVMKGDPQVKLDAITALGEFHDPRAINALADQFTSYDFDVPSTAVTALVKIGPASFPRLLADSKNPKNDQVRANAIQTMAGIGGPPSIGPILAAAKDPSAKVRAASVLGMGAFTGPNAVQAAPLLIASFRDPSPDVSNGAVASLTALGTNAANTAVSRQIVTPLVAMFNPSGQPLDVYNTEVYYAERVLSQIGAAAVPQLVSTLRSGTPVSQKWAALALGDMKKDRAAVNTSIDDLRKLAQTGAPEARWAAQDALNRLGVA